MGYLDLIEEIHISNVATKHSRMPECNIICPWQMFCNKIVQTHCLPLLRPQVFVLVVDAYRQPVIPHIHQYTTLMSPHKSLWSSIFCLG